VQLLDVEVDAAAVDRPAAAPTGEDGGDGATVLVGEPGQDVPGGLLRCRGGDVAALVPDHVPEPQQLEQGRGCAVPECGGLPPRRPRVWRRVVGFQGIDRVQPQLHTTGRVRPHGYPGGLPHAGVLRGEPDRVTVRGGTHDPIVTLHNRHRHAPTLSASRPCRARITSIAHWLTAAEPRATRRWIDMQRTWVSKASGPLAATSQPRPGGQSPGSTPGNERCRRASRQRVSTQVVRDRRPVDRGGESDPRSSDACIGMSRHSDARTTGLDEPQFHAERIGSVDLPSKRRRAPARANATSG
jgi:hypothetical protein